MARPRLVGINHVALEVDDLDRALEFYGRLFDLVVSERTETEAFVELGDQFIALFKGRTQPRDVERHFGLVVDDKEATRRALEAAGAEILVHERFLDFIDPDGNRVQVVQYDQVMFTKAPGVLRGMGLDPAKSERSLAELRAAGLAD